jgi:hypothetical protein
VLQRSCFPGTHNAANSEGIAVPETPPKAQTAPAAPDKGAKDKPDRLADALRANLSRRKAQQRARKLQKDTKIDQTDTES